MSSEEDVNVAPEPPEGTKDSALFEPKPKPKVIRVLTVLAYILSVSMAAILLSIYYIFMWNEQAVQRNYNHNNNSAPITTTIDLTTTEKTMLLNSVKDTTIQREMQQQITAGGAREIFSPSTPTVEENTTLSDYDLNLDSDFSETSTFIKKLLSKYPHAEND